MLPKRAPLALLLVACLVAIVAPTLAADPRPSAALSAGAPLDSRLTATPTPTTYSRLSATPTQTLDSRLTDTPTPTQDPAGAPTATETRPVDPTRTATPHPSATNTTTRDPGGDPSLTPTQDAEMTATPTLDPEPTNTLMPMFTPNPNVDLVVDHIEVIQSIQDLNNSVRLVAHKRTFVRVHAHSLGGSHVTNAILRAENTDPWFGGGLHTLAPINQGTIVKQLTHRGNLNQSFLFELPSTIAYGTVNLEAIVNPGPPDGVRDPIETSYANNAMTEVAQFENVGSISILLYQLAYSFNGPVYVSPAHVVKIDQYLTAMYPASDVHISLRFDYLGAMTKSKTTGLITYPTCHDVNSLMAAKRSWDMHHGKNVGEIRYYGLVSDYGGFMRGCSPVPGYTGAGPTGTKSWGWDYDGCYGDWYTAHELGHAYGRYHANYCGATGGPAFPYPDGRISPALFGTAAIYGMYLPTMEILPPASRDIMSYCGNLWVSPFTYYGLMDHFQANKEQSLGLRLVGEAADRLLVVGSIDTLTGEVHLQPMAVIPDAQRERERVPGDYAIILYGAGDVELARYPFTPGSYEMGPVPPEMSLSIMDEGEMLEINELVPYVDGTVRVDVTGPEGTLASVSSGAGDPSVTLIAPNGGEVLPADDIAVSWMADDPDGDALSYTLQFSADGGATWEAIATGITETTVLVDGYNVSTTTDGRMRVWASDGIHTTSDASDASFTVPNRPPELDIFSPEDGATSALSQTLSFEAWVYDADEGTLMEEQITWSSDVDGALGQGETWSSEALSVGQHTITCAAQDSQGAVVTDAVSVTIVADRSELPVVNALVADPGMVTLRPDLGLPTASVAITNLAGTELAWTAACEQDWVVLGETAGATGDTLIIGADTAGLTDGTHLATVVLTSADLPGEQTLLYVELRLGEVAAALPLVMRE